MGGVPCKSYRKVHVKVSIASDVSNFNFMFLTFT